MGRRKSRKRKKFCPVIESRKREENGDTPQRSPAPATPMTVTPTQTAAPAAPTVSPPTPKAKTRNTNGERERSVQRQKRSLEQNIRRTREKPRRRSVRKPPLPPPETTHDPEMTGGQKVSLRRGGWTTGLRVGRTERDPLEVTGQR